MRLQNNRKLKNLRTIQQLFQRRNQKKRLLRSTPGSVWKGALAALGGFGYPLKQRLAGIDQEITTDIRASKDEISTVSVWF